jgi:hypothetical protein
MILSEALIRSIVSTWDANGLDVGFKALWDPKNSLVTESAVLNWFQASPGHPSPYVVVTFGKTEPTQKMSKGANDLWETRKTDLRFQVWYEDPVFTGRRTGLISGKTAKEHSGLLADQIKAVYGGHDTTRPSELTLAVGSVLGVYFQRDFPASVELFRTWVVEYSVLTDSPLAV